MRVPRHEIACRDGATVLGGGEQTELRRDGFCHFSHAHSGPGLKANGFHPRKELFVRVKLGHALVTGQAKVRRAGDDHRHGHIHAGDFDPVKGIADVARGQKRSGRRADDTHEV